MITVAPTRNEYTATAGQTIFTYTFKIFADTDLNVYVTLAGQEANDSTDQVTPSLVTGVGDEDGGTITIPATGLNDLVTIVSDIPASRTTDYQNNGDFRPVVVNADFDRVVSLVKQVEDIARRSLVFPESQQNTQQLSLPSPEIGSLLRWKDDLSGLENVGSIADIEVQVGTIAQLRALDISTITSGTSLIVNGYYAEADGGGGPRRILAKGGSYTDNGGSIIVPDGGDGSAAWIYPEDAIITWLDFGAKNSGLEADGALNAVAIQNATDAAKNKKYEPEEGTYFVDRPIRIPSYINMKCQATGTSTSNGVILKASTLVTWPTDRGVIETRNFDFPVGYDVSETIPEFWNTGSIENLAVSGNNVADYGCVIWAPGEQALLRRVAIFDCVKDNMFLGGFMSVMQVEDSSVFRAGRRGIAMQNHPNPLFAPGASAEEGGRGNGGSVRFFGISGDLNVEAHIYADGSQIVELCGLKSEKNIPDTIVIGGSGVSNARQRWNISGFRSEGVGAGTKSFIKIIDTAKPQIVLGAGTLTNYTYLVNDTVLGQTILPGSEGAVLVYDRDVDFKVYNRILSLQGRLEMKGNHIDSSPWLDIVAYVNGGADETYFQRFQTKFSGTDTYSWKVGENKVPIISVDGKQANGANGTTFYSWDGVTTQPIFRLDNDRSLKMGLSPASDKIGFWNSTGTTQPTVSGSKGGNAALGSLITALSNMGLIVDSTT